MKDHYLKWTDDYLIGQPLIDSDHKTLFAITNDLHESIRKGAAKTKIARTISKLVDYIESHFQREESLFIGTDYPDTSKHMAQHREIEKVVQGFSDAYAADPESINVDEILEFLKKWLTDHILRADRTYKPFINT